MIYNIRELLGICGETTALFIIPAFPSCFEVACNHIPFLDNLSMFHTNMRHRATNLKLTFLVGGVILH